MQQAEFIVSLPDNYGRTVCGFIKEKFKGSQPVMYDNLASLPLFYDQITRPVIIITTMHQLDRIGCPIQQPIRNFTWAGMIVLPEEEFIKASSSSTDTWYFIMNPAIASHLLQSVICIKQYNLPQPAMPQQSIFFIKQSQPVHIEDSQRN